MRDGLSDDSYHKNLVGGFYDAGDAIKFNFPQSFALTMLSWSVIEYRAKYEAAAELDHVLELIKWGTDYLLKTFNSSAESIDVIAAQVCLCTVLLVPFTVMQFLCYLFQFIKQSFCSKISGSLINVWSHILVCSFLGYMLTLITFHAQVGAGDTSNGPNPNDIYCWMRPEDINYPRPVYQCHGCSDLAAEMAATLAAASIVFKGNEKYSKKLVHGAQTLFKFSRDQRGRYSQGDSDPSHFYNSTGYYDEYVWGAAWMYYATGNVSYLQLATTTGIATHAGAFSGGPDYGVLSWNNKLPGAQVDCIITFILILIFP